MAILYVLNIRAAFAVFRFSPEWRGSAIRIGICRVVGSAEGWFALEPPAGKRVASSNGS